MLSEKRSLISWRPETSHYGFPNEKWNGPEETDLDADATKLDLNRASLEEFKRLPGVGEKTAERILEFRRKHGTFHAIEELMAVRGIGTLKFEKMKSFITVDDQHEKQ
ncbi:MAG: helix-hairpin-helix domain-containing protein [Nitrospirae bacterium]|nr:helix-hairpin-helix domain-containing protein [Nitrospirota bacterium]MBI3595291.1 helix-hairpin-helix domain-containing protein [Nitrospirota bacterium]